MKCRHAGFTLIEVMIAMVIVAILAAIALPSYRVYIERSHRAVAKSALSEVVSRQHSYYTDRKRFALTLDKLGWTAHPLYLDREGAFAATSQADSIYQITLEGNPASTGCPPGGAPSATGFTAIAQPVRSQVSDTRCAILCLSSAGIKSASGTQAADCWQR